MRIHDPVNAKPGEIVSLMGTRKYPYGNVSAVLDEVRGKITNMSRSKVSVTCHETPSRETLYFGVWVIRDDIGYLHEVPEPVCLVCEETIECACVRHTV